MISLPAAGFSMKLTWKYNLNSYLITGNRYTFGTHSGSASITQTNGGNTLTSYDTLTVTGSFSSVDFHDISGINIFIDGYGATVSSASPSFQQPEWYNLDGVIIAGFYFHNFYGNIKPYKNFHDNKLLDCRFINDVGNYINQPVLQFDKQTTDMVYAGNKNKTFYNDSLVGCRFEGFTNVIPILIGSNWGSSNNEINRSIALDFYFLRDTVMNVTRSGGGSVGAISGTGFNCIMDRMVFANIDGPGSANASHNETVLWYGTIKLMRSKQSYSYASMLRNVVLAWNQLGNVYRTGAYSAFFGNVIDHQLSYTPVEFASSNAGNRNSGNGFFECKAYSCYNTVFNTVERSYNSPFHYYGFAGADNENIDTIYADYNAGAKIERDWADFHASWDSATRGFVVANIGTPAAIQTTIGNRIFQNYSTNVFLDTVSFLPGTSLRIPGGPGIAYSFFDKDINGNIIPAGGPKYAGALQPIDALPPPPPQQILRGRVLTIKN